MQRRVPPALRRSRLFKHLLAGIAAIPVLGLMLAGEDLARHWPSSTSSDALSTAPRNETRAIPVLMKPSAAISLPVDAISLPHGEGRADIANEGAVLTTASVTLDMRAAVKALDGSVEKITLPLPDFVSALPADLLPLPLSVAIPVPRAVVPALDDGDLRLIRQAIEEYRRGNIAAGDAIGAKVTTPVARLTIEWAVARLGKQAAGFNRLAEFVQSNRDMPMASWVENRAADSLFVQKVPPDRVLAFFGARTPETGAGKIALARALAAKGDTKRAESLARDAYRDHKTYASTRDVILRDFAGAITPADQRYLAERLIYEGKPREGLALAAKIGPAAVAVANVLAASIAENGAAGAMLAKLDPQAATEPAALYAKAQMLRRSGKFAEAAQALLSAPNDPNRIVDGDEWWVERRMLARKLLDAGDPALAYRVVAAHQAETSGQIVDAEVHAGWLSLRFLNNAAVSSVHFARARDAAETPTSTARAEYWQGRAAEALGDPFASDLYAAAASHRHTFYGQLAMARIGQRELPAAMQPLDEESLRAIANTNALRAVRALLDVDARDLAQPLIYDFARKANDLTEVIVLGDLLAQYRLPKLTLQAGKAAAMRGLLSEEHAFPTFGIPDYEPAPQSAEAAIVYSIARQESEFDPSVVSHAGARGLMQLMPATAVRTAGRQKIGLDVARLTTDPALNAKIGAAHLAELFGEYNGSYILSFAAYNAGGKRVREWTTAYGDPRDPAVDKVDWIERIPISETRHYVQKILENLQIYRARINGRRQLGIIADLERGAREPRAQLSEVPVAVR